VKEKKEEKNGKSQHYYFSIHNPCISIIFRRLDLPRLWRQPCDSYGVKTNEYHGLKSHLPKLIGVRRPPRRPTTGRRSNWEEKRERANCGHLFCYGCVNERGALKHFGYAFRDSQPLPRFKASRWVHSNNSRAGPRLRMRMLKFSVQSAQSTRISVNINRISND